LLQARGHVDGIAGDERVPRASHHLAGVDADARPQAELLNCLAQLQRRPHGPQGVILVQPGDAEDGHDRITDELLHGCAVSLQCRARVLEVARLQPAEGLGVEALAPARVAGQVAEDHGDDLADLAGRPRLGGQLGPAGSTEAKAIGVLLAAAGAGDHVLTVESARISSAEP
jgi:hypothetical protein